MTTWVVGLDLSQPSDGKEHISCRLARWPERTTKKRYLVLRIGSQNHIKIGYARRATPGNNSGDIKELPKKEQKLYGDTGDRNLDVSQL
jgi:hypothetical protein